MNKKEIAIWAVKGAGVLGGMALSAICGKGFEEGSVKMYEAVKKMMKK